MMEELLPLLKKKLQDNIQIIENESELTFKLSILEKSNGKLIYPGEIENMLIMFGGLNKKIPMEVHANEEEDEISLKLKNKEDFMVIKSIFHKIWENSIYMFSEVLKGNFEVIREIPDIDD